MGIPACSGMRAAVHNTPRSDMDRMLNTSHLDEEKSEFLLQEMTTGADERASKGVESGRHVEMER